MRRAVVVIPEWPSYVQPSTTFCPGPQRPECTGTRKAVRCVRRTFDTGSRSGAGPPRAEGEGPRWPADSGWPGRPDVGLLMGEPERRARVDEAAIERSLGTQIKLLEPLGRGARAAARSSRAIYWCGSESTLRHGQAARVGGQSRDPCTPSSVQDRTHRGGSARRDPLRKEPTHTVAV